MNEKQLIRINKLGLKEEDFKPKKEEVTIEDVVEALDLLASIVLESEEQDG